MKKAVFTVLAVALLFCFCACAGVPSDTSSGSTPGGEEANTFYLVKEFDREGLGLEEIRTFMLGQGYEERESQSSAEQERVTFRIFEEGSNVASEFLIISVYDTAEEAKLHFMDPIQGMVVFRTTSHCRINNMVLYATNSAMNELASHFELESGFRNVIADEDCSLEDVFEVLRGLGFSIYGDSEGYEAISYCGREAIEILICETAQEFEDACAIIPLRLSDEEYALELPLDPYATMLAFRQGQFVLIGDADWLYLVRTCLEQAAA